MKFFKTVLMIALCGALLTETASAEHTPPRDQTEGSGTQKASFQVGMYRIQKSLTMNVLVEKKLGDRVEVQLLDQKGNVLFEDMLGKRQLKYGRKLDFSQIQDGRYSVVVTNGNQVITKEINLSTFRLYEMPARNLVTVN